MPGSSRRVVCDAVVVGVIAPGLVRVGGKVIVTDLCNWECHRCGHCETVSRELGYLKPECVVRDG